MGSTAGSVLRWAFRLRLGLGNVVDHQVGSVVRAFGPVVLRGSAVGQLPQQWQLVLLERRQPLAVGRFAAVIRDIVVNDFRSATFE